MTIRRILKNLHDGEQITISKTDGIMTVSFDKLLFVKEIQLRSVKGISKDTLDNVHNFDNYLAKVISELVAEINIKLD
jgi:hypothetical protein